MEPVESVESDEPTVASDETAARSEESANSEAAEPDHRGDPEFVKELLRRSIYHETESTGIEFEVVDAATRAVLLDATVTLGDPRGWFDPRRSITCEVARSREDDPESTSEATARSSASLRKELPGSLRPSRMLFWIGAPGHATIACWLDVAFSGWRRHQVALPLAAKIEVVVHGPGGKEYGKIEFYEAGALERRLRERAPGPDALLVDPMLAARSLRTIDPDFRFCMNLTSASDPIVKRVDGVPSGDWFVLASVGSDASDVAFGCARAKATAEGDAARFEFQWARPPAPLFGSLSGVVRFAAGWTEDEILSAKWVRFRAVDRWLAEREWEFNLGSTLQRTPDRHVFRFDAGWNRGGRWSFAISEIPAEQPAILEGTATARPDPSQRDGRGNLELFIDEPATLIVRVRDRRDGRPIWEPTFVSTLKARICATRRPAAASSPYATARRDCHACRADGSTSRSLLRDPIRSSGRSSVSGWSRSSATWISSRARTRSTSNSRRAPGSCSSSETDSGV